MSSTDLGIRRLADEKTLSSQSRGNTAKGWSVSATTSWLKESTTLRLQFLSASRYSVHVVAKQIYRTCRWREEARLFRNGLLQI